jgi:hypothetical protein
MGNIQYTLFYVLTTHIKLENFMEGGKLDFELNCCLITIVDYALEALVHSYWAMVDRVNVRYDMQLLHASLTLPRGHHPRLVRIWLISWLVFPPFCLALVEIVVFVVFHGILHTGMKATTTPSMKYIFAHN